MKIITRKSTPNPALAQLPPLLQHLFSARGIESTEQLDLSFKKLLPFDTLKDIDKAVQLLHQALTEQKRLLIVGDFDADGATSCALMINCLRQFGFEHVEYLVPNRFEFGYGLTPEIVAIAKRWQPDLIITVDNGIASIDGVDAANALGIEVLVTDHHLPGDELPAAAAIVNPNQPGDNFPSKNLAGVGVSFYLMIALRSHLREKQWFNGDRPEPNLATALDLVALGTVADVVPLDQNNRILVQQGLKRIIAGHARPGIQALLEVANRNPKRLAAADLGFAVGPRLNAAGRLDDMSRGIECLLSQDLKQARSIASDLDKLNQERKTIETDMQKQALTELRDLQLETNVNFPYGLSLYKDSWHQGVVGILASRLKDKYHRPVIAFARIDEGMLKGSARSVKNLNIRNILDEIATSTPGLIDTFGGHAQAAGLSLKLANFSAFSTAFDAAVRRHLTSDDLEGKLISDGQLAANDLQLPTAELLRSTCPWGQAFPEPLFDGRFKLLEQRLVGEKHLKLTLQLPDTQRIIEAIYFNANLELWPNHRAKYAHVAYRLNVNEYQGWQRLQLLVENVEAC